MTEYVFGALFLIPLLGAVAAVGRRDPVWVLGIYLLWLFALPARWVVGPLGGAGPPAVLVGLFCAAWWMAGRVHPEIGFGTERSPVRLGLWAFAWIMLLGYAIARSGVLSEQQLNGTDRAVVILVASLGVALLTLDGLRGRHDFERLVRLLLIAGGFMAALGIAQFLGFNPVTHISVPGLSLNSDLSEVATRSLFNRPVGTALHGIEYSIVLAMLFPFALHAAWFEPVRRRRHWRWLFVGVMGGATLVSLSRTGILGLIIVSGLFWLGLHWRARINALAVAAAFLCVTWAAIPGLIGTIRGLFTRYETDGSIQARIERLPQVTQLVGEAPWLGHGFGTYNRDDYFLLDNQYYKTAIESGALGLAAVVSMIAVAVILSLIVAQRSPDPRVAGYGRAVAASLLAAAVAIGTFDAFHYHIFRGLLFMLIGCAGALWRLERRRLRDDPLPLLRSPPAVASDPTPGSRFAIMGKAGIS